MNQSLTSRQLAATPENPAAMDRSGTKANEPAQPVNETAATIDNRTGIQNRPQAANDSQASRARHPRRHVQRYLKQLERIVRHQIRRELNEAEGLDRETSSRIKELAKEFRHQLQDTYLAAGRGHEFDPAAILTGLSEAVISLTEGLREINGTAPASESTLPPNTDGDETVAPLAPANDPAVLPYAPVAGPHQPAISILELQA